MEDGEDHNPDAPSSAVPGPGVLAALVAQLCEVNGRPARPAAQCPGRQPLPSRDIVIEIVEALRAVLYPGYFGKSELTVDNTAFHLGSTLDRIQRTLQEQVRRGLCFACENLSAQL